MKKKVPESVRKERGLRVREVRQALQKNQVEMSKILEYSHPSAYNQIELGVNNVSPRVLAILKHRFSVNSDYILEGAGKMFITGDKSDEMLAIENRRLREEVAELREIIRALLKKEKD